MSFSSGVKEELLNLEIENSCCERSLVYGMLLFGRAFDMRGISMLTDSRGVAEKYLDLVEKVTGVKPSCTVTPSGKFILSVDDPGDRAKVFASFNLTGYETPLRINRSVLTNEADDENNCCFSSFIRGAFLSCGTVCDPNKMYALEFVVSYMNLSEDLKTLLKEMGIEPKIIQRRGARVVYYKDSSRIEDVLTIMGAMESSLEIMGIKVYKDVRNRINRKTNFETANISRTVTAAVDQIEKIEYISEKMGLSMLSEDLQKMAKLRTENPDMSLRELGEQFDPPISRSGANHKLSKLIAIYNKLIEEENR